MKNLILALIIIASVNSSAQNNTVANLVEGSKAFIDLVRVFKAPKNAMYASSPVSSGDSCAGRGISDVCIKNGTAKVLLATLYRRNTTGYATEGFAMRILPGNREWLYEMKTGVYKMKLETIEAGEQGEIKKPFREGEIKLNACQNLTKTIKEE